MKIYITRHGETKWNKEHRLQGQLDSPLTEQGQKQAQWLHERLLNEPIDLIISSPLGRALKTAEMIKGHRKIPIVTDPDFMEIKLGDWEGQRTRDLEVKYPVQYNNLWNNPHRFENPTGESLKTVINRAGKALETHLKKHAGKNILIVTHGITLKSLYAYIEKKALKDFWSGPYMHQTALTVLEYYHKAFKFITRGDISHYQEKIQ